MRVARSTSSSTCAGAAQILCAVSCCMQERAFHCVPAHTRRTVCRPDRSFALPGMLWGVAQVDLRREFLVILSSGCKPDCGDQAPIPCMSAHSQKLACAFAYQSGRQRSGRRSIWSGRPSTAGSGVSQPSAAVFRQSKNTPGFLLPGVFFIGDCEKLSWYRCSWSQAGCCRHR